MQRHVRARRRLFTGWRPVAVMLLTALIASACTPNDRADGVRTEPTTASPAPGHGAVQHVALRVGDAAEAERVAAAIDADPAFDIAPSDAADSSSIVISDEGAAEGSAAGYVAQSWVAVTDQRRDVFELTVEQVRAILAGEIDDWSDLGGSEYRLRAYAPEGDIEALAALFGLDEMPAVEALPGDQLVEQVASDPGGFALVAPERLRLGALALVVDGHDPYRDPAGESPLRIVRHVSAPDAATAARVAALAGWEASVESDPAGVLATGELIPARCVTEAYEAGGGPSAMFDATRPSLRAADLTVVPLETTLTDRYPPTPCTETFALQGRSAVVDASAGAGIDVVITAGNHAKDCWGECDHNAALLDTLDGLEAAGIATTGAGATLDAAREPAVVEVDGVTFAFLGYDDIAHYYAATDTHPGTAPLDLETLAEDVASAADRVDHVIVGFSWGVEYVADPTERQRAAARIAVEAGASLILGNHPHWVQGLEVIDGALVLYAQGNFIFDQDWSVETTQGVVLEAGFDCERLLGYRLRPTAIRDRHRAEFVDPADEGAPILERIWEAADSLPTASLASN